jgi:hypothetical protein
MVAVSVPGSLQFDAAIGTTAQGAPVFREARMDV